VYWGWFFFFLSVVLQYCCAGLLTRKRVF
jgi:hypothetical protein